MSWYLVVAAGMLIGLHFRAGALMAATLLTVILSLALSIHDHGFGWYSFWITLQSVILLQLGYLAGLSAAALWRHSQGM